MDARQIAAVALYKPASSTITTAGKKQFVSMFLLVGF